MFDISKEESIHPWIWLYECTSAGYSRLSFRRVLWCGDDVSGVGKLWRSRPRHHREHGGSTSAAPSIQGHHAQQVLSIPLEQQPCSHHPACLLVHRKATVTTYRETKSCYSWYFSTKLKLAPGLNTNSECFPIEEGDSVSLGEGQQAVKSFSFFVISFQWPLKGYISLWSCDIWMIFFYKRI